MEILRQDFAKVACQIVINAAILGRVMVKYIILYIFFFKISKNFKECSTGYGILKDSIISCIAKSQINCPQDEFENYGSCYKSKINNKFSINILSNNNNLQLALMEPILMLRLNFVEFVHLNVKAALTTKNA